MQDQIALVSARVEHVLEEILGVEAARDAKTGAGLIHDGYLDSFALLELSARLEMEMNIVLPADSLSEENFQSSEAIARLCAGLLSE